MNTELPEAWGSGKGESVAAFDAWAEYYDLIHDGLAGDVEFYVGQAVEADGDALELGVGTGRIAIPMVMAGVNLTGLDSSPGMLEACRKKKETVGEVRGAFELIQADMTDFDLGRRFAFIAMPYRTFMHLLTPGDQRQCLRAVRRHLAPEGRFVLNTWTPRVEAIASVIGGPLAEKLKLADRLRVPGTEVSVEHYHASSCDDFRQTITELHVIREVDDSGRIFRERRLPLVRAWTTPREMDNLVQLCGFQVAGLYGDFDGGPFTEESKEMIWVLEGRPGRPGAQ